MLPLKENEIRLLVFNADSSTAADYSLIHVSLDHPPKFYALSYAWADESLFPSSETPTRHHIRLDGNDTLVGPNLSAALEAWRTNEYSCIPPWVDFLCIDQLNISERNHQVLRMYSIYDKAAMVTVWLGPDTHDSGLAFDFMRTFAREAEDVQWIRRTILEHTYSREWHAVDHLLHRNWWRRVWIIQEMVAATEIDFVCGGQTVQRNIVLEFFSSLISRDATYRRLLLREEGILLSGDAITLANIYLRSNAWEKRNLLQTIYTTGRSSATDNRDKVYGVLGLAYDAGKLIGTPNYSLSIEEVYKRFAVSWVREYATLEFLSLSGLPVFPRSPSLCLPTWTPDFNHRKISSLNSKIRPATPTNAAQDYKADATFSNDLETLTARGICFDIIDGVGYSTWGAENGLANYQMQQSKSQAMAYTSAVDTIEALSRTLIGDSIIKRKPYTGQDTLSAFMRCYQACIKNKGGDSADIKDNSATNFGTWYEHHRDFNIGGNSLHDWVTSVSSECHFSDEVETTEERYIHKLAISHGPNRRLLTTSKGYFGLGVNTCMPGDLVCVLYGCSTPVLLRRVEDHYTFLGEAYLHGIMNGEAIGSLQRGELNEKSFIIR
ncbi:heterokaryon incompatibility protein-domain-containing protein [Leptodontidium sp. MPI-SDFR-AT-0119]|nr:heterokaryon incompatibility protein-domain-containing protein [Leptodontidium sp. MPI-SDFR-AT-0119]